MARAITTKPMQLHGECLCGFNVVQPIEEKIAYKDFSALGVRRKKDSKTGQPFLVKIEKYESCEHCNPDGY